MTSLMLDKDLPYHTRERNRRRELLTQFVRTYEGVNRGPSGTIIHIEESPFDLADALCFASTETKADRWFVTSEDGLIVQTLQRHPDFPDFKARADAVWTRLTEAEDTEALRAEYAMHGGPTGRLWARASDRVIVSQKWQERAHQNSSLPTTLSKLGPEPSAELMRQAFALAMSKLHILRDYPLCDVPSIEELKELMRTAEETGGTKPERGR